MLKKIFCFILIVLFITVGAKPLNNNSIKNATIMNNMSETNYRNIIQSNKIENNFDDGDLSKSRSKDARQLEFTILGRASNDEQNTMTTEFVNETKITTENNEDNNSTETIKETIVKNNTVYFTVKTTSKDSDKVTTEDENASAATTPNTPSTTASNPLTTILEAIVHKFQFSPHKYIQEKLDSFKATLMRLGLLPASNNTSKAKQLLNTDGLIHLAGLDDNGFYTNRLEPAGFFGGNGWFANKGGLLGGPGAILSTGSVLTDYPTSYRKKK